MRQKKSLTASFGARLKYWRELRNMTIKQLAEQSTLSRTTIKKLEYGNSYPTLMTVEVLLNALNISIGNFYGEE